MLSRDPRKAEQPKQPIWHRAKLVAISAFLLFHLFAITCWCIPLNSLLIPKCKQLVGPYVIWSGLFQAWDMFAPNPSKLNIYIEAEVTFLNGQKSVWKFPKMHELGYTERYFKERFRKFSTEYLLADTNAGMWPDAARYVARVNSSDSNPAVCVRLIRHWSEVGLPETDGSYKPRPWFEYGFFTYRVKPADLR